MRTAALLAEHLSAKPFNCLACFASSRCNLSVKRPISEDNPAQIFEVGHSSAVLQLSAISKDGWFKGIAARCGLMKDFGLIEVDGQPKQFRCLGIFVEHQL